MKRLLHRLTHYFGDAPYRVEYFRTPSGNLVYNRVCKTCGAAMGIMSVDDFDPHPEDGEWIDDGNHG